MTTFHEQMKNAREFEGRTIRDYPSWTLQDYRDFMFCVEKGYLWQECGGCFIINQEWEGDDIYAEEFLEEEDEELKCLGFRPQSRIGECEGCKAVCEECENLMIMEEEDPRPMFCTEELTEAACEYWIDYNYTIATNSKRWKFFDMTEENLDDGSQW